MTHWQHQHPQENKNQLHLSRPWAAPVVVATVLVLEYTPTAEPYCPLGLALVWDPWLLTNECLRNVRREEGRGVACGIAQSALTPLSVGPTSSRVEVSTREERTT